MKKYFYLVLIIMSSLTVQAQKKDTKAKNQKETVVEYEEEVIVETEVQEIDIEDEELIKGDRGVIYLNKKKYKTRKINDNCTIYYKDSDNNFGIIKNGKRLLPNIFHDRYESTRHVGDEIVLKIRKRTYTGIYGVFDLVKEKWILPLEYDDIKKLEDNYYAVRKDDYYAILDLKSKKIIVNEKWKSIDKIDNLKSGYYKVTKNNTFKYGVYSIISKKTIIPCMYSDIRYDLNLNYFKVSKDNKYNYVNVKSQFLFKNWYDFIVNKKGFFFVKKYGKVGVIDREEKEIVPIKYLMIQNYRWNGTKSYFAQNKLGKYGFLSLDGTVTLPFIYNKIEIDYYNRYAKLKSADDKYGLLISKSGKIKIISSCKYDDINGKWNYFIVVKDGKYGLLDTKGEKIVEEKYDYIDELKSYENHDGFVLKKGKNYFLFANGKIFKEKYKDIKSLKTESLYSYGRYLALKSKTNKYGLMDSVDTGKMLTPFMFDDVIYSIKDDYHAYFVVKMGKKMGIYDILNQKMVVQAKYDYIVKGDSLFYGTKDGSKVTIFYF